MKVTQSLYGDEVGGAIVPEESGDFLTELAREALEDKNTLIPKHSAPIMVMSPPLRWAAPPRSARA